MASLVKRGDVYYLQWYAGPRIRRRSLKTATLQIAKERLRQFESARFQGAEDSLPTRTPIAQVVSAYVEKIRTVKTAKSAQTDVYYLRETFGPVCPALEITSRKPSERTRKRPKLPGEDRRECAPRIEGTCFEAITTADVAGFLTAQVRRRALAPKTANRYREIIVRLFNWATREYGIRLPRDRNPAAPVQRYKENAPTIRYLTLPQISEQLEALKGQSQLQAMVAVYIYAGLWREELLWLTRRDVDLKAGRYGQIRIRAKTCNGAHWQPKTRVNRMVPISSTLRAYLDTYVPGQSDGDWYFPSPQGKRWDADNFSTDLRAANSTAGLPWACLDYRHTFGSQLAQAGISLYKISQLMGNSPDICRRHYASLIPEALLDEVEFRNSALGFASPDQPGISVGQGAKL